MTRFDKFTVGLVAVAVIVSALAGCKTAMTSAAEDGPTWYPYPKGISEEGKIHFDFGEEYSGAWSGRRHQGIDIQGHKRQGIIAIADGVVSLKDHDSCAGGLLVIDHGVDLNGEPLFAHYLHLSGYFVEGGQHVKRGDLIAYVANPGYSSMCWGGQHLHLQLSTTAYRAVTLYRDPAKNPHLLWADGPWRPTCFEEGREYLEGTITYPILCDWQIHTIEDLLAIN